jgi:hypothetical protein
MCCAPVSTEAALAVTGIAGKADPSVSSKRRVISIRYHNLVNEFGQAFRRALSLAAFLNIGMRFREINEARPLTKFIGKDGEEPYYADQATVLYHGTSLTKAREILSHGLHPKIGDFVRAFYPKFKGQPVIFAADDTFKRKCFKAALFAVSRELGYEHDYQVEEDEFYKNAAVLVIEADRNKFKQATTYHKPQRGIEKFDYYSFSPVTVDKVITGEELKTFFGPAASQHFMWAYAMKHGKKHPNDKRGQKVHELEYVFNHQARPSV